MRRIIRKGVSRSPAWRRIWLTAGARALRLNLSRNYRNAIALYGHYRTAGALERRLNLRLSNDAIASVCPSLLPDGRIAGMRNHRSRRSHTDLQTRACTNKPPGMHSR